MFAVAKSANAEYRFIFAYPKLRLLWKLIIVKTLKE
jgi:hypothetical protein